MVIKLALRPFEAKLGIEPGTLHGLLEALPREEADTALKAAIRGDLGPLRAVVNRP